MTGITAGPIDRRATWHNPRIFSTLLLVFLAGAAAGAVSMKFGLHDFLHRSTPVVSKGDVLQKFKVELNLTPEQAARIALVLEDYQHYYGSVQEQLDDIRATGKMRILQELDPAQREKFGKMTSEIPPQLAPKP